MSRIVVLGGTGEMGTRVLKELRARGHDVTSGSRASGLDVMTGSGLGNALTGADCVVDCLNHMTMNRRRAIEFFRTAAGNVLDAATAAGIGHIVCLSIVNVTNARVRRAMGYYGGKATQEETYAAGSVPLTVVRTTAWFSLAQTFLDQIRLGRLAVVPRMHLRPVHPDAAATAIADAVDRGPGRAKSLTVRELAGPEEIDAPTLARRFVAAMHHDVTVLGVPMPLVGLRWGLLPDSAIPIDPRRFADWLDAQRNSPD